MTRFAVRIAGSLAAFLALGLAAATPARADDGADIERAFDRTFGTVERAPRAYETPLAAQIASLADASQGRIGVAAIDLASGQTVDVLGNQRFPLASTSKIAIAATFLEGVDQGRWSLTSEFPLMVPVRSEKHSSAVAPVREGNYLPAHELIELMITRSSNPATDALLAVVGGPRAVNDWVRRAGIKEFQINRDIATLVRDDGELDPAAVIDSRDSATPLAMAQLLSGIYRGRLVSPRSREVIIGAMERCVTGKRRIPAYMPETVRVAHKTGSLYNTSSDIGIIQSPEGRTMAVAIYVTGQGSRVNREERIASIARAIYDGFAAQPASYRSQASR